MTSAKEIVEAVSDRIAATWDSRKVFGEPVVLAGRTVVPAARVRFAFGGGGGGPEQHSGGGGGGHLRASPVGAFEISAAGTRFIPVDPWRPLAIAASIGFAAGLIAAYRWRK